MVIVFAATDNEPVNRSVLAACRKRKILCSAVDSCWPDGDFVMPAICREEGLVVTVATGGRSCRRSRIVKDKIAEILKDLPGENPSEKESP
jgi:siroheme synthase (precorrin-2 oxidase/ferrochelatase)